MNFSKSTNDFLDNLFKDILVLSDSDLAHLCLSTDSTILANIGFSTWRETKSRFDSRIEWHTMSDEDQFACFILEKLIHELAKVQADEAEIDDTFERKINWTEIFGIIRRVIKAISSFSGVPIPRGEEIDKFAVLYYKFLMINWDANDDREGLTGYESRDMCKKLGGEQILLETINNLFESAANYFSTIHTTDEEFWDGDEGGGPDVLEPV